MRNIGRKIIAVLTAASLVLGFGVAGSQLAMAEPTPACATELKLQTPNAKDMAKTPVLAVHGLGSTKDIWSEGGSSMIVALADADNIVIVEPFDYESANTRWVTDKDTAQRLAKTIICYSKLYGNKHVVLVAHSMGGLLAREALDWAAYGTFAKNVTGHIATIATPHTGTLLANADSSFWMALCEAPIGILSVTKDIVSLCRDAEAGRATSGLSVNSGHLAKLPRFPAGISVKAIAGEVRWQTCAPWGCSNAVSTGGDLVVPVGSATDEYTTTGRGDGKTVFSCETTVPVPSLSPAWCEHGNMLQAPQVQSELKKSIEEYLKSTRIPAKPPVPVGEKQTFFGKFTLVVPNTWGSGMSEPNIDVNLVDFTKCNGDNAACPHIYFVDTATEQARAGQSGTDPVKEWSTRKCESGANGRLENKGVADVGGQEAEYYQQIQCGQQAYFWYVKSKKIAVEAYDSASGPLDLLKLQAVLANIVWK